jgi:predicted AlkP superfamily pyrophosphatase or phosphodiesterase
MRKLFCVLVLLFVSPWNSGAADLQNSTRKPPKLVVVVIIDQFRYDYLTRFRDEYTGGFDRLLKTGAVFTNAYLQHFPSVTAVGHSTILTGATPSFSGIVGNDWFDRESGRFVTSILDSKVTLLGGKGTGASPSRLLVSSIGDELKIAARGGTPRVIGISLKDRAAIFPAGRMADAAYWFDNTNGNMVSSTYYFPDVPAWVKEFNTKRAADGFPGAEWKSAAGKVLATLPTQTGSKYYDALERSPYGTQFLLSFAERAIEAEALGARSATDLISVSLSSTDLVGHSFGPDSPEIHDLNLQTDRQLGQFLQFLDKRLSPGTVLVVLTADHGVAPLPEVQTARKMPGGRIIESTLRKAVESALVARFGEGQWISSAAYGAFWLNRATIREKKLDQSALEECAAQALSEQPHVYRVYTRTQLLAGRYGNDLVGASVANGFYPSRAGDVITILDPYWIYGAKDASHGTPFGYDTHLPLIFAGAGVKRGVYDGTVAMNDIAPTLATILGIETPSGSTGRVLTEMLEAAAIVTVPAPAPAAAKK